jgi:hypothetical protein
MLGEERELADLHTHAERGCSESVICMLEIVCGASMPRNRSLTYDSYTTDSVDSPEPTCLSTRLQTFWQYSVPLSVSQPGHPTYAPLTCHTTNPTPFFLASTTNPTRSTVESSHVTSIKTETSIGLWPTEVRHKPMKISFFCRFWPLTDGSYPENGNFRRSICKLTEVTELTFIDCGQPTEVNAQ